ncbi:MAG: NAD(P)H-hydrate dehydratase [Clostridiales bacterium]|nr:NAD(P)H-hydrate dehydratase [Clostridiales bacterium]
MDNDRFQVFPYTVYTYESVDSTNAVARRAIAMIGDSADLTVHVAGEQTAGKGRNGRTWLNTDRAVMMSIVHETKLNMDKMPILNLAAAMAVRNALVKLTDNKIDLTIKWPNDVLTSEKLEKICGILSEAVRLDGKKYAIIGIGVNLDAARMPGNLLQPATSVYLECGKHVYVLEAVKAILKEFDFQYKLLMSDPDTFLRSFAAGCVTLGRHVAVINGDEIRYGIGEKLAPNGQLIVNYEDGQKELVYAADVSVRNQTTIDENLIKKLMPKRPRKSNKGDFGRAAIIAGTRDMPGAGLMCVRACLRAGAGLTKALIPEQLREAFSRIPEAMLVTDDEKADELISWASAIGIGCGLGVNERTRALVEKALRSGKNCVIDADALNTMAKHRELLDLLHAGVVITPHPAEMARLMECDTEKVVKEFSATAIEFAARYGCCVLLKSASSIIVSPNGTVRYNDSGNSGLAKGGSGDVLAGIVTAMLAQGAKPFDAASIGSFLLGSSAEKALSFLHDRFILAGDITDIISSEIK